MSFTSWTLMMNSDSASSDWLLRRSRALARRTYWALVSRSRLWAAWMSPLVWSMVKMEFAPSPDRKYLAEPSPLSQFE